MGKFIKQVSTNKFRKLISTNIISSVIWIIIGAVMFFMPDLTNKVIGMIVGIIFLITGVLTTYKFMKRNGAKLYSLNLVFGIVLILLGLVAIISPVSVSSFITVCLGIYLVVMGANKITYGIWFKVGNDPMWLITVVIGLMFGAFGVLLLINPFAALTVTQLVGTFLIISSILDITNTILLCQRSEEIVRIFW